MAPPAATATSAAQKQILAAIQALSDRMDAQGMAATGAMDVHFSNQDELASLRANKRIDPLTMRLDSIDTRLGSIEKHFDALDSTVLSHDKDIGQLKTFCDEQVKPALVKVVDLRIEFAKMAAVGGGFGVVATVLLAVGKAAGWW